MGRESLRMNQQRGSTLVGFIIGLVVGLGIALGVAIYVTKVPIPFMSKGQTRSADLDAAEAEKNKDWDPNAPLYGKKGAKSAAAAVNIAGYLASCSMRAWACGLSSADKSTPWSEATSPPSLSAQARNTEQMRACAYCT
jgi:hypothetical protein